MNTSFDGIKIKYRQPPDPRLLPQRPRTVGANIDSLLKAGKPRASVQAGRLQKVIFHSQTKQRSPKAYSQTFTGAVKPRPAQPASFSAPGKPQKFKTTIKNLRFGLHIKQEFLPWALTVFLLFVGFSFGLVTALKTPRSIAETQSPILPRGSTLVVSDHPVDMAQMADDQFYHMTVQQLDDYLDSISPQKLSAAQEKKRLLDRTLKLTAYLQSKNSPFTDIVDTLVKLPHWQMVLAVSNSESSLGKRCDHKNCSGIGVAPGNPLWREYPSEADWAKDLNNLLEKRYKDWTLEQMNGVYNQPGSKNWVLAAKEVLTELQQNNIE